MWPDLVSTDPGVRRATDSATRPIKAACCLWLCKENTGIHSKRDEQAKGVLKQVIYFKMQRCSYCSCKGYIDLIIVI